MSLFAETAKEAIPICELEPLAFLSSSPQPATLSTLGMCAVSCLSARPSTRLDCCETKRTISAANTTQRHGRSFFAIDNLAAANTHRRCLGTLSADFLILVVLQWLEMMHTHTGTANIDGGRVGVGRDSSCRSYSPLNFCIGAALHL